MANFDGSIKIDTKVDTKGINKGTKEINGGLKSVGKSFKGIALAAVAAAAVAAKVLVDLGKKAVNLASNLQEVQNVVDVSFGKLSDKIEKMSKQAIETLGMSELSYKQFASSFMVMGKSMGLAEDTAFGMSVQLTKLVGDMSSFYNISQDMANTALKSIFTGETETLKKYGIVMTETNLKHFALSKGIQKNIDDMTQAEKTQLRYLYVTEQLAMANGDFVRTQDSWANQTRILSERVKELLTLLGEDLIKILTPIVQALNKIVNSLIAAYKLFKDLTSVQEEIEKSSEKAAEAEDKLAESLENVNDAAKKTLASFDDLTILKDDLSKGNEIDFGLNFDTDEEIEIGKGTQVHPDLQYAVNEMIRLKNTIEDAFKKLTPVFDALKETAVTIYESLKPVFDFISDKINYFVETYSNGIAPALTSLYLQFQDLFDSLKELWAFIEPVLSFVFDFFVNRLVMEIKNTISVFQVLIDLFQFLWELVKELGIIIEAVFTGIIGGIYAIFTGDDSMMESFRQKMISTFSDIGNRISQIWNNLGQHLLGILKNIVNFFALGINEVIRLINKISIDVPSWVPGIGGQKWGFNIPEIPKLATGAVIPPNSEFMAILGDQKSGTNIETPEALLRQIYREESNNEQVVVLLTQLISAVQGLDLTLDGRKVSRGLYPYMQEMNRIKGGNV